MQTVKVRLNGEERSVPAGWTVADLLADLDLRAPRVAVEKNRQVVPRATYPDTPLEENDAIEVVSFFGGG